MIYLGNRSMTKNSHDTEIDWYLNNYSQDNECVADRAMRETGLSYRVEDSEYDPRCSIIDTWVKGDGWEFSIGCYGLSDDDLETLTIM